jgi:outer membrane protein insertion porin family
MIHQRFKILVLLLSLSGISFSQQVNFKIEGNSRFPKEKYIEWLRNIKANDQHALKDTVISRLAKQFSARGYWNFRLDSLSVIKKDSLTTIVFIHVSEGKPTTIKEIKIKGVSQKDSARILPTFEFLKGKPFTKSAVENALNKTLLYFENNGFPFAEIKINSLQFASDTASGEMFVNIALSVNHGKKATVDKIETVGNESTKSFVIAREFRYAKGEEYSQSKIEKGMEALKKLNLFSEIDEPEFYLNEKGEGILVVHVKEKQVNGFDGIIGYVPSAKENEKGFFTGYLNISLRNIFGTGRALSFRWQRENKYSQELELKYLEPWLLGFPLNLSFSLFQRKQDTSYVKRIFTVGFNYLASAYFTAFLTGESELVTPLLNSSEKYSVLNSSRFAIGGGIKYDSRDNLTAPTRGVLFSTSYLFSRKEIKGPQKLLTSQIQKASFQQKVEVNFGYYLKIHGRAIAALNIAGRELKASQPEESDLYRIGGASTVRGYREKQFSGSRALWTNAEFRFLLDINSFAFLFYDAGYIMHPASVLNTIKKSENFLASYGLGFSLETALGILKISYAIAKGTPLNEGFIHFGLANSF